MSQGRRRLAARTLPRGCALGMAIAAAAGHASGGPPACPGAQQAVFSCSTGTKAIAVCASRDITATTGTLHYRFGRPDRVELAYPPSGSDWRAVTRGGTLAFSGGGGAFLAFDRPPYRYVVYTAIGKGWGRKSGVVVEKHGRRIASVPCRSPARSDLGPQFFSDAGIAAAGTEFELP